MVAGRYNAGDLPANRAIDADLEVRGSKLDGAQINGHIHSLIRLSWVRKVTEGLVKQRRLKMADDGPLELLRVTADSEADPMRRGQIQLTVRFGVLKPIAQHDVLRKAFASDDIDMEVRQLE